MARHTRAASAHVVQLWRGLLAFCLTLGASGAYIVGPAEAQSPSFAGCPGGAQWNGSRCDCPGGTSWLGNSCKPDAATAPPSGGATYSPPSSGGRRSPTGAGAAGTPTTSSGDADRKYKDEQARRRAQEAAQQRDFLAGRGELLRELEAHHATPPPIPAADCPTLAREGDELARRGDAPGAVARYRNAKAHCPNLGILFDSKLADSEAELSARETRAGYLKQSLGLVGGTSWELATYFRDVPPDQTAAQRAMADKMLRAQLDRAGIDPARFAAIKDYDFIIGLATSKWAIKDVPQRVIFDQLMSGRATPAIQEQYNLLKHKSFDVLDCHSNGAMICLAALANGDITARMVRLLGPQLSPDAMAEWLTLLDHRGLGNKIDDLEIVIGAKDPVPPASYYSDRLLPTDAEGQEARASDGFVSSLEQFQLNPVHTLRRRNNRRNRLAKSYRVQRQWPAIVQVLFERRPFAMQPSILKTPSRLD